MNSFSDYIVYVDESGDHGLKSVNPAYPIFVLSFCIFEKEKYISQVVAKMKMLKFNTFGHDLIILHERDIRKKEGDFYRLGKQAREDFINAVSTIIKEAEFTIVAVVIRKELLNDQYIYPANPYHLALEFGLERVYKYISSVEGLKKLHFIFESRGLNEDQELELEFRRFRDGENIFHKPIPFSIKFADKKTSPV